MYDDHEDMRMERTLSLWIKSLQIIVGKFFFIKDYPFIVQVLIFLPQVKSLSATNSVLSKVA